MVCQEHESAYWDGSKGVCCDKTVMKAMGGDNHYACCENEQTAYWNGSSALCCDTATNAIVTNYINGQTDTAYACCETKEDEDKRYSSDLSIRILSNTGWTVAGAVNGSCCGGWTNESIKEYDINHDNSLMEDEFTSYSYSVRQNGGVYYCGEGSRLSSYEYLYGINSYVNDGKYCFTMITEHETTSCWCSNKGDPRENGSSCDP